MDTFKRFHFEPTEVAKLRIQKIKLVAEELEKLICDITPTREIALSMTRLEESIMWAERAHLSHV